MTVQKTMEMVNDYCLKHTPPFPLEIHGSGVSLSASHIPGDNYPTGPQMGNGKWGGGGCEHATINKNAQLSMHFLGHRNKFGLSQALLVRS